MEFGDAVEMQMNRVDGDGNTVDISKEIVYKIEVAANRYDLLCLEGIAASIRSYLGLDTLPRCEIKNKSKQLQQIIVKPETQAVRPFLGRAEVEAQARPLRISLVGAALLPGARLLPGPVV